MGAVKIATCCYCGVRAALTLTGQIRHELSCSSCGAPLSKMKMFPNAGAGVTAPAATPTRPKPSYPRNAGPYKPRNRPKKKSGFSRLALKVVEEVWDEIEDFFD